MKNIKQNFTDEEFDNIFSYCSEKLEPIESLTDAMSIYEDALRDVTSQENSYLLLVDSNSSLTYSPKNIEIHMSEERGGILYECYDTKRAHIIANARRSFLYRKDIDNFFDLKIRDILVVPITNDKDLIAIHWIATIGKNQKPFTQENIEHIDKLSSLIKPYILSQTTNEVLSIEKSEIPTINILAVDDSPIIIRFIELVLKDYDIKIFPALSGHESIESFKENSIHVIFMDEIMAGMSGHEATEAIRKIELDQEQDPIPIFGLTSDTNAKTKDILMNSGMTTVLYKPIKAKEIIEAICKFEPMKKKSC